MYVQCEWHTNIYVHTQSRNELHQTSSSQHALLLTVKGEQMLKSSVILICFAQY